MALYSILKTHWLLPYHCILCADPSLRKQDLCEACYQFLPSIHQACQRCAKVITADKMTCGSCLTTEPPFDIAYAAYLYAPPLSNLILDLKFRHSLVNARILGELLVKKISEEWYQNRPMPEAIFPVPLHKTRMIERGFNQAVEIARPIARTFKIPLLASACIRTKNTQPQATLAIKDRTHNIKNAFAVAQTFSYRHVAVIDDVITTGHTISEFCKTLKKSGLERIDVWCCARPAL
jgi:ComF family protein